MRPAQLAIGRGTHLTELTYQLHRVWSPLWGGPSPRSKRPLLLNLSLALALALTITCTKEVPVEVIREVEVEVVREVTKEVPVEIEVVKEVTTKVPVEVIKEVIKEVEVEVIKEVIKEVPVEVVKEVTVEVPVEVIKEVEVPVEVVKEVVKVVIVEVPAPTAVATPTAFPTAAPTSEPPTTPTAVPTPTAAPAPTVTAAASPTPTATPVPEPTARPSDLLDWFDDPPDDAHSSAARSIGRIWDRHPDLAVGVARLAWVADGITWYEEHVLEELSYIMHEDPESFRVLINQGPRFYLLGLDSESARQAAEYPWLADGVNAREFSSVIAIARIARRNPSLAERVSSYTWLADGIIENEARGLDALTLWASQDPELVDRVLEYTWLGDVFTDHEQKTLALLYYFGTHAEVETTKLVMDYPWLVDGVTGEEVVLLAELTSIVDDDPEAARSIGLGRLVPYLLGQVSGSAGQAANFPWLADGVDTKELMAVIEAGRIAKQAPELAGQLLKYAWLADGVSQRESDGIRHMASLARENLELARQVVGMGMLDDPLSDRDLHALTALVTKADFDNLALLTNQPWFSDGLSDEETAFLAVTPIILDTGHRDILQRRFTRSATISLPLAGDVDVWAFWHSPFPDSDDTIELIEDAARASEALMGVPFPTTDIIILLGEPDRVPTSGFHAGNHIAAQRSVGGANHRDVIYHETAHYYYMGVHSWFNEGYADLLVTYTMVQEGLRDLEERIDFLEEYDLPDCVEQGYRNIQELLDKDGPPCLGELFLDSLLQLFGEEAMSAALRELYFMRTEGREPTEADVYQIFLKHTPDGLEDEFRDLYKRLHAGPYADTDT